VKRFLKLALKVILSIFLLGIGAIILFLFNMRSKVADVKEMCAIASGTPVEKVIPKARSLGFSEAAPWALGSGLVVHAEGQRNSVAWSDDTLPGVQSGKVQVGKVIIPPFYRFYCEVTFSNRTVISTRSWILD
jgi:hypothetical protein